MKNINTIMRSIGLSLVLGSFPLMDVMGESVTISHLVNEQNIVLIKDSESKYLLLPVQENAPEGKVNIVVNNELQLGTNNKLFVWLSEKVDYYVPLDLSAYQGKNNLN